MKLFRKDEGFTLIELMVVVLIIGILVAIAIPVFSAAQARARERSCHANQRTIDGACQSYLADNPTVAPTALDAIGSLAGFLKAVPVCPEGGAAYTVTDAECQPCATHGSYQ